MDPVKPIDSADPQSKASPLTPANDSDPKVVFPEKAPPKDERRSDVLRDLIHPPGSALSMGLLDAPHRGKTSCIGKLDVTLVSGTFTCYLFETSSFGNHIIALTMGDLTSKERDPKEALPIRIHSECITSETLGGCDCDCVEQLNGALAQIAKQGRGIVFYMRQEGRGAGYGQKGRDRMAVAGSLDQLGTYEIYEHMGLPADARQYDSIKDVVYLLGLENAHVNILTNNPDKIEALGDGRLGLNVDGRLPIVYQSNPQNAHYLRTKGKSGHFLDDGQRPTARYPWDVRVFAPHILPDVQRFRIDASYPLPVRPKHSSVVIPAENALGFEKMLKGEPDVIEGIRPLSDTRDLVRVEMNPERLRELRRDGAHNVIDACLADTPYWFNDHVYHDQISQLDFVVLEYSRETAKDRIPLVRIQSESLLSRFPLAEDRGSSVYAAAVQRIVEHGRGLVLLYPEDGRGNGIAAVWKERELIESGRAKNVEEACEILGIPLDDRDYRPVARLIKHHYGTGPIDLIFGSRDGVANNGALLKALAEVGIRVNNMNSVD